MDDYDAWGYKKIYTFVYTIMEVVTNNKYKQCIVIKIILIK